MQVSFHGVRGSIATAGESTRRYGGNTSCVTIEVGERLLIFDAGTGIRGLGTSLMARGRPIAVDLFFSHLHWDHIQGFPFFAPAYLQGNRIDIWHSRLDEASPRARDVLSEQMRAPTFPIGLEAMRAELAFHEVDPTHAIRVGDARVRQCGVDHPNGCVAWRVEAQGRSVVYATDLEHALDPLPAEFVEFCRGTDLLIYDAMYTPSEYESRRGWGHGTWESAARVAEAAAVGRLCLFHHDPSHDDAFMDGLADQASRRWPGTIVAAEGLALELADPTQARRVARG